MFPPRHRLGAALVLALFAGAGVTACAAQPAPAPQVTETTAGTPTASAPEPSATPTQDAAAEDPTCETLIGPEIVADFESVGWTSQAEELYIGDRMLDEGLQCVWADFEGPAGDHLQMFGWGRISADDASESQAWLVSQGWIREDSDSGVYITTPKGTAIVVDDDGYGMTYLFGDGWVKFADTKQGILLIEWPKP
ncbi:hypothetical protein [Microbacterium sp. SSM24]|uniref:hypothetical protein n=1 Tax=Microbacterium sp. SSM24 TaxID=2991714 RepID=UPI002226C860|nr:hypothetical protein [Microbacterium sp. SSM24]MCW3494171.1 hypothetical protein [Microbacterium sp. SSM24]